jgi:hypothetical protein
LAAGYGYLWWRDPFIWRCTAFNTEKHVNAIIPMIGPVLANATYLDRETSKKTELISSADSKSSGPFAVRIREGEC